MNGRISNYMQIASVRRYELTEGNARGLKVIDCDNGKIRFLLNESKALDIMQLYPAGQNVSFISKNGFTAREIPFVSRFEGGMLYTCGLDSVGGRDGFELHGTHHNTPAFVTRVNCTEQGITVEAEIASASLFGKNLVFKRKIFSAIGSETLEIFDTLENRGYRDEEYCLLYHVNVGYPMLDEDAKIVGNIKGITSRTVLAREYEKLHDIITAPIPNQEETCYFLDMGEGKISLVNEKLKKTFTLEWSKRTLPHFVEWKSMASGDYALGLEPCTTELDDRFKYEMIGAGSVRTFELNISVNAE